MLMLVYPQTIVIEIGVSRTLNYVFEAACSANLISNFFPKGRTV